MPSNNVFQYSKIRTRKRSAKKSIKTGKKMESSSFWNPESTVLESGIQYPESGIHSMESRIQDCPGFPCMGREVRSLIKSKNLANTYIIFHNRSDVKMTSFISKKGTASIRHLRSVILNYFNVFHFNQGWYKSRYPRATTFAVLTLC